MQTSCTTTTGGRCLVAHRAAAQQLEAPPTLIDMNCICWLRPDGPGCGCTSPSWTTSLNQEHFWAGGTPLRPPFEIKFFSMSSNSLCVTFQVGTRNSMSFGFWHLCLALGSCSHASHIIELLPYHCIVSNHLRQAPGNNRSV